MPELPQKLLGWLQGVLLTHEYRNVDRTFSDIAGTLSQVPTLSPRTDIYSFQDGHSALLLHLTGTLPVFFRGAAYSFPISLWIPHGYPFESPIAYVIPTKEMTVRPSQYVSDEGRIYHPYIAGWQPDRFNILELVRIFQEIFSREPPVRSKQSPPRQPPPAKANGIAPPLPPLPPELGGSSPRVDHSRSTLSSSGRPPPPPPKPFHNHNVERVTGQDGAPPIPPHPNREHESYRPTSDLYTDVRYQTSQPYSPTSQYRPQRVNSLRNDQYPPILLDRNKPPPITFDPQGGSGNAQQVSTSGSAFSSSQNPPNQQGYHGQPPPPLPQPSIKPYNRQGPPSHNYYQPSNQNHGPPLSGGSHVQPNPKPPEDLLTSPFDAPVPTQSSVANFPAPPIPRNPEKEALLAAVSRTLTQHLHSNIASNAAYEPPLRAQNLALQSAHQRLLQEQQSLNALSALLTSNEAILRKAMHDADNCIKNAKHRTVPGVDEVLVAPTVVGEQLYKLVAEETACVDARGMLGRALDKGRVGSEDWVKRARGLGREEFLNKVTIKKCAQGLGLRSEQDWS
ncbi:hypothetical protein MMC11_006162 [Xylographa trunciseda]|nr:hypothetical protein [Xylographa trunciseda]